MKDQERSEAKGNRSNSKSQQRKGNGRPRRSRKEASNGNRVDSKFMQDVNTSKDQSNDVAWYARNPELLKGAASLPFSQTTGTHIGWDGGYKESDGDMVSLGTGIVPGVMGIEFLPTIGGYQDDAVNAAKDAMYSFTVHANSRNTKYNSSDIMLVTLAAGQVFAILAAAIRAYGLMRTYDQRNKYLPDALVSACGFNANDLRNNLNQMWFDINEMIARSSQIWVTNELPLIDRWFWMNSNVYQDSQSIKGQYYVFSQGGFLMYDETKTDQGGGLSWVSNTGKPIRQNLNESGGMFTLKPGNSMTWSGFKVAANAMIDALLNSEDRGIMMGDILNAYGASKIYAMRPIPVDYSVVPVYNREVLTQIENLDVWDQVYMGVKQEQTSLRLYTDWGSYADDQVVTSDSVCPEMSILNFHQKEPVEPAQIMVATRLKALGYVILPHHTRPNEIGMVVPKTMGTEYVRSVIVLYYDDHFKGEVPKIDAQQLFTKSYDNGETPGLQPLFHWATFDWAPWLYDIDFKWIPNGNIADYKPPKVNAALGDYDQYTVISTVELMKMNTTAIYSEFAVPTI